jgi:hypothetical protein
MKPDESTVQRGGEAEVPAGWTKLPVEHLPQATFWPAGFALGIAFVFWGLITSWVVLAVGVVMFAGCLAGWIAEIRHERKHHP